MNHYAVAGFSTFVTNLFLAGVVYAKNPTKAVNRLFALFSIAVATYGFGFFGQAMATTPSLSLFANRILLAGTIFIPIFFLHLTYAVLEKQPSKKALIAIYTSGFLFEFLNLLPGLMAKDPIPKFGLSYLFRAGFCYPLIMLQFGLLAGLGLWNLFHGYRSKSGLKRNQLKYLFWSTVVGFAGGSAGFALGYDIDLYPFNPFGAYCVPLYCLIFTYAIVKHRLMDINLVVRDTAVHLLTSLLLAIPAIVLMVVFGTPGAIILTMALFALAVPLLYSRLKALIKPLIEKTIFGNRYQYLAKLGTLSDQWYTLFNLHKFLDTMVHDIMAAMRLSNCSFLLFNEDGGYYELAAGAGLQNISDNGQLRFGADDPFVSFLNCEKKPIIKEEIRHDPQATADGKVIEAMDRIGAEISIPFMIDGRLRGILSMGAKPTGEMYNQNDLEVLAWLAQKGQILFRYTLYNFKQSQLFARYSHDLGNPLSAAKTYIKLMLDGDMGRFEDEEDKRAVKALWRNIDFVDDCIQDMKFSSRIDYDQIANKIRPEQIDVSAMVRSVAESMEGAAGDKGLKLTCHIAEGIPAVCADKNRMERLIRNLLVNAIKFTQQGGVEIRVNGEGNEIRLQVMDTGPGIPKRDLPKIFDPFFRTEGRTQIVGGTGLGLNIVKKIIELHNARISVDSEMGKGTSFTVMLPVGQ